MAIPKRNAIDFSGQYNPSASAGEFSGYVSTITEKNGCFWLIKQGCQILVCKCGKWDWALNDPLTRKRFSNMENGHGMVDDIIWNLILEPI